MIYKAVNCEVALPTHILQTADHRVCDSAHKYKHLPAKKSALANSFYNRTVKDWHILESGIQSETAAIFINCDALANPNPPPPWRDSEIVRTAT